MAIGPVQLVVLGFREPDFHGEIIAELERLRDSDTVRVIDSLVVYKDAEGELEVEHLSNLSTDEAIELGTKIGALVGLGIEGEEGMEAGAVAGAPAGAAGRDLFSDEDPWDLREAIPQPPGPGRDRAALGRRGHGPPRHGDRGDLTHRRSRNHTQHHYLEGSDVRISQSRPAHVPAHRSTRLAPPFLTRSRR